MGGFARDELERDLYREPSGAVLSLVVGVLTGCTSMSESAVTWVQACASVPQYADIVEVGLYTALAGSGSRQAKAHWDLVWSTALHRVQKVVWLADRWFSMVEASNPGFIAAKDHLRPVAGMPCRNSANPSHRVAGLP